MSRRQNLGPSLCCGCLALGTLLCLCSYATGIKVVSLTTTEKVYWSPSAHQPAKQTQTQEFQVGVTYVSENYSPTKHRCTAKIDTKKISANSKDSTYVPIAKVLSFQSQKTTHNRQIMPEQKDFIEVWRLRE